MLFNSSSFIILLAVTFIIYYFRPFEKYQKIVLIAASLVFYSFNNHKLTLILMVTIAVSAATSYLVLASGPSLKKVWAVCGITAHCAILAFFKFSALISKTCMTPGSTIGEFMLKLPLPLGISFFIFKGISLVVDVFRSNGETQAPVRSNLAEHSLNTSLYISFFPQLLAGPIQQSVDFSAQITIKYFRDIDWNYIIKALILGYFLKMVVADNLKEHTFFLGYPYLFLRFSPVTLVIMTIGFSMEMFADFAGYSLIAIGISSLFGYRVKDNFNFPYISKSISEFWRRWHISLSSFFRDYLFIPLGGSREGTVRTSLNLFAVMVLCGVWHGAGWNYILWGALHGGMLVLERLGKRIIRLPDHGIIRALRMIAIFALVSFSWIFFKLSDISDVFKYCEAIWLNPSSMSDHAILLCINILYYSLPVALYHVLYLARSTTVMMKLTKYEFIPYGIMLFLIITNSGFQNPFIYFQY